MIVWDEEVPGEDCTSHQVSALLIIHHKVRKISSNSELIVQVQVLLDGGIGERVIFEPILLSLITPLAGIKISRYYISLSSAVTSPEFIISRTFDRTIVERPIAVTLHNWLPIFLNFSVFAIRMSQDC